MSSEGDTELLPFDNIYKIQIGNTLFNISGQSLCHDAPSFFTDYFKNNTDKQDEVLYVDRSAAVFEKIYQHLQGYAITVRDEHEFATLFTDAIYFHLPNLLKFLKETEYFYVSISGVSFKVPKKLFSRKGDSPNFFHMTSMVDNINYSKYYEKSISRRRPLPISAQYIPRSPDDFKDILKLLNGGSINMDDDKRKSLIKECRYYMLLNLEQRLMQAKIIFNPLTQAEDMVINLCDLKPGGIEIDDASFNMKYFVNSRRQETEDLSDDSGSNSSCSEPSPKRTKTNKSEESNKLWNIVKYKRPFLDDEGRSLTFQINSTETSIYLNVDKKVVHFALFGETRSMFERTFGPALLKAGIDLNDYRLKVPHPKFKNSNILALPACLVMCDLSVNGSDCPCISSLISQLASNKAKINYTKGNEKKIIDLTNLNSLKCSNGIILHCTKCLWKIGVNNGKLIALAVKAQTYTGNSEYCKTIEFI